VGLLKPVGHLPLMPMVQFRLRLLFGKGSRSFKDAIALGPVSGSACQRMVWQLRPSDVSWAASAEILPLGSCG